MSNIKFVSHEKFPEDQYTKELVYLCLDDKYRVAYVRKQAKNGGLFWGVGSIAVTKNGSKTYFESFLQDSSFLEKDIKAFLENRSWENKSARRSMDEEIPF
jgi:hypothetical protein